jgi:beta-glucosidase
MALRRGVGGFIIFGGPSDAVQSLTRSIQERCDYPLLFGSDLERGAGQQFRGATHLPPAGAIGSLDDLDATRRCGGITARDARSVGVNWVFAPVADINAEADNPIVGTRAFGSTAAHVSKQAAAWIEGCRAEDVIVCAKHFPGHGRTTQDSHAELPRVKAPRALLDQDLAPFAAAIGAGADAVMTAHVLYDALDPERPATLSTRIINDLLRTELGFTGIVVTDGLGMQGLLDACDGSEPGAAIAAVNAGCDALLYPTALADVADALDAELGRALSAFRVAESIERMRSVAERVPTESAGTRGSDADRAYAAALALRCIDSVRGAIHLSRACDVIIIDDDTGGPFPAPARTAFTDGLLAAGLDIRSVDAARPTVQPIVAVFSDVRAWKGTVALSASAHARIEQAVRTRSDAVVILFGHPRLAEGIPGGQLVVAWGGENGMQRAAAEWIGRMVER